MEKKIIQTPFGSSGLKTPRYYQENAVNRALDSIAEDKNRVLLTLATGTGKTYISSQISHKLYEAKWSLDKESGRRPRILFLAVPLTTSEKDNKYYYRIGKVDEKEASVIFSQIRLIDTKRLVRKMENLNKEKFEEIRKAVKDLI
jgi:CRISPR/Cas system-associated endonuclease/helicase Cas3